MYFYVNKKIIGSFEECDEALRDDEINESIDVVYDLKTKDLVINTRDLDYIDGIILSAWLEVYPPTRL